MKTFTNCAEKKAKQILNLLQGYTKGIRMTAILVLLLMGVSNAWGWNSWNNKTIYFDNSLWASYDYTPQLLIGRYYTWDKESRGSSAISLTKIQNTDLWYLNDFSYGNYTNQYFIANETPWDNEYGCSSDGCENTPENRYKYATHYTNSYNTDGDSKYNLFIPENKDNNASLAYYHNSDYSTLLNYNQTVQQHLSTNGNAYATSTASIATVKVSSYKLSNATTAAADSKTIASSKSSATCSAARTATVTYSVTGVNTGYKFVGWYDGNTQKSTSTTYTYQATTAKTITARFEKTYAVTISAGANGTVSPSSSQQVGSTSVTIKATANTGYKFKNWTTTGGVVITNANNATTTITATATGTVKANFEEDLSSNWKLIGDNQTNSPFGDNYTYSNGKAMTKKSGHSTESNVYITLDIKHLPDSYYGFKVATSNSDDQKYGYGQDAGYYIEFNRSASNSQKQVYSGSQHELKFIPDALGEYEFRVNYPSNKYVYVTFPTAYAVTFGTGTGGSSVTAKYSNTSFSNGTKVQSGKTVTFTQTASAGYTFKEWNTKSDGTGTKLSSNATYTHTVAATNTVYAVYTKNPDKTIYLEPTGHWNANKAVFQAHVWQTGKTGVNLKMEGIGDPSHADGDNKSPYRYYKVEVPAEYDNILFFRKDNFATANENAWNKTGDLTIPIDNNTLYVITDNTTSPATGTWKAPNFVYTITLGYCDFGTYGIKYNGQSYFSKKPNDNVTIDVPAGAQIEILEGQPFSNAYTGDVVKKKPTNEKLTTGQTLTINGDVTLDDNFVTKKPHVVYLGIPDAINTTAIWAKENKDNFIYTWDTYASYGLVASTRSFKIDALGITYYEFTIPEERHSFRFQRKTSLDDKGDPHCESVSLEHEIPLTDVNCFTLKNEKDGSNRYKGTWGVLPAQPGDYRLLYVEQVVEKSKEAGDEWKTIITRKKAHPSNIVRNSEITAEGKIVSLHTYKERKYQAIKDPNATNDEDKYYTSSSNSEIILQKYDGTNWNDVEWHMVYGPLETLPIMANLPGRRNTVREELYYDDGIEIIKKDLMPNGEPHPDQGNGVWNFVITQDNAGNATLDLEQTHRYEGEYYIRTDVANGGWDYYTNFDNYMTRSDISKQHSNYSHYFCKWVGEANVNVKYTIANDYGIAISDTLEADKTDLWGNELANKMVGDDQLLPAKANVRFSWNEKTNGLHRAYIAGATNTADRFLVLGGKTGQIYNAAGQSLTEGANNSDRFGLKANEEIFSDIENWVYQTDVQITPGAELQVTAKYNNQVQYFVGKEGVFNNTILQGSGTEKYLVRLLYDFKTNELISAYVPGASTHVDKISTNLMIIRQNYDEAKQLVFNNGDMSTRDNRKAYGVIEFTENYLKDPKIPYLKRCLYWVSFPFDVNLSEAFGSLVYGKHWLIQEYDGARRAAEGLWKESESFWTLHWEPNNITLKAGLGYVIEIDINQMINDKIIDQTDDKEQIAALYFPSSTPITKEIIEQDSYTVNIPAHKCEIVRTGEFGDRTIRDSHWNVIGVPSYINTGATFADQRHALNNVVKYYYQWEGEVDKYTAMEADEQAYSFHSMYAYMVQYAGDITWNYVLLDGVEPAQIAAKKNSTTNEHAMRLELQQGNSILDKTFIRLQDDVATPSFDFNYDLCKITNKGANIYSIITAEASPVEVAANVLPVEEAIIPLGIKTDAADEYTFAMPDGTDGIVVELIDYENNTRTNMLLDEYTVNLGKGTFENRFALHVKPNKTTTSLEDVNTNSNGVKKYLIDGVLYMQKDGVLYDAQGKLVR